MAFWTKCPCGLGLKIKDELHGKMGKCPKCQSVFRLVRASEQKKQASEVVASPEPDSEEDEFWDNLISATSQVPASPVPPPLPAPASDPPPLFELPPDPPKRPKQPRSDRRHKAILALTFVVFGCALVTLLSGGRPSLNPVQSLRNASLQAAMTKALEADTRNRGITAKAYYGDMLSSDTVVFDLIEANGVSRADVFRVLWTFAEKIQDNQCSTVVLAHKGQRRFRLAGSYFREIGRERSYQNPIYVMRTFPEHVQTMGGASAFSQWTGGVLGVMTKQMEDFNEFHDRWYGDGNY